MVTLKVDEERLTSTIALIENHLDGAVADFERGMVENVDFIDDMIYVHKILEAAQTHGFSSMVPNEYEERMTKAKAMTHEERMALQ